mmetsp:Transcript_32235/g.102543  ORF Transcript_32235/g.102543 Transcript_32235/m.102543 type:complete len:296 (+) Transcript_32235:846-1733(+)
MERRCAWEKSRGSSWDSSGSSIAWMRVGSSRSWPGRCASESAYAMSRFTSSPDTNTSTLNLPDWPSGTASSSRLRSAGTSMRSMGSYAACVRSTMSSRCSSRPGAWYGTCSSGTSWMMERSKTPSTMSARASAKAARGRSSGRSKTRHRPPSRSTSASWSCREATPSALPMSAAARRMASRCCTRVGLVFSISSSSRLLKSFQALTSAPAASLSFLRSLCFSRARPQATSSALQCSTTAARVCRGRLALSCRSCSAATSVATLVPRVELSTSTSLPAEKSSSSGMKRRVGSATRA